MNPQLQKFKTNNSISQITWLIICIVLIASMYMGCIYMISRETLNRNVLDIDEYNRVIQMKTALNMCDDTIKDYINSGNRSELVQHNESVRAFHLNWEALYRDAYHSEELSILTSIDNAFYSYQTYCNYVAADYWYKNMEDCYLNLQEAQAISVYLQQYCDDLMSMNVSYGQVWSVSMQNILSKIFVVEIGVLLILIALSIYGILFLKKAFYKPLSELHHASLEVAKGNYNVQIDGECQDLTMNTMTSVFNEMIKSIADMITRLEEKKEIETDLLKERLKNAENERLLEQASFRALQSQINPHFLFNTLNGISRTIILNRGNDAISMIDSLAVLLRYSLNNSVEPVLLKDELWVVRQYVVIQQYRLQDRVRVVFDVDEHLTEHVLLPRLTMQPVVENAMIHGLEPKIEPGTIWISVKQVQDICEIVIRDDGIGIDEQQLESFKEEKNIGKKSSSGSIGIQNIRKRMEFFTGKKSSFAMENHPEGGLQVRLQLPVISEERSMEEQMYV